MLRRRPFVLGACQPDAPTDFHAPMTLTASEATYTEPHRPQVHFTPPTAWMNDPNGMVFFDGEYHLFYQHHPASTVWGPMHWGHAISPDLVRWEHRPIALHPDAIGAIFSGSAVVDAANTAGFQQGDTPALVAIYTQHSHRGTDTGRDDVQTQSLAYSTDRGRTWTKHGGNPVLPNPPAPGAAPLRDFRDPKVLWHEETQRWVMALAVQDRIQFYGAPDLKAWTFLSEFGADAGAHGGVWECPDLFPLTAPDGTMRWVLLVSIGEGGPNGGSGTQYFLGDFDGTTFTNANPADAVLWLDYGRDNYAGVTWSGVPAADGRRLFIGWMSNWQYAQIVPTDPWRSAMTVPRSLHLVQDASVPGGYRIASRPVEELRALRGDAVTLAGQTIASALDVRGITSVFEGVLTFDLRGAYVPFGLDLANAAGDVYRLRYDPAAQQLTSDRTASGAVGFASDATHLEPRFAPTVHTAPLVPAGDLLALQVVADVSSIEVFAEHGRVVFTETFFPSAPYDTVRLVADGGTAQLAAAMFWPLASIWN
ncbi:MAG: glycoside hydrolase family 32 protein [Bacteroidota bacterium]